MEEAKGGEKKKKVACKHPPDEYERMMEGMDRDGDGKVTWDEFVTAAINKVALLNDANIRAAFNVLDADGNGRITVKELKDRFAPESNDEAGEDDKMWDDIMKQADLDGCGAITWGEFRANMTRVLKMKMGSLHGQKN